jgi:hypothetical protein
MVPESLWTKDVSQETPRFGRDAQQGVTCEIMMLRHFLLDHVPLSKSRLSDQ